MLVNIYSSEIFKMIFMISTHLVARKEQDRENCEALIADITELTNSIKEELIISRYIEENIQVFIEK